MKNAIGLWRGPDSGAIFDFEHFDSLIRVYDETIHILYNLENSSYGLAIGGDILPADADCSGSYQCVASLPPLRPEHLGDAGFKTAHNVRYAYVGGAMANGIASAEMVINLAKNGMMGFFGSAGLSFERLSMEIDKVKEALVTDSLSWGMNLIHSPGQPVLEEKTIRLYLRKGVHRIEASAFMSVTPAIVHFACKGLYRGSSGRVERTNYLFAKISRPETARHFLSPAPRAILDRLVRSGELTAREALLASEIPLAEDITVESDSGGHTDNRPLGPLFSAIYQLREEIAESNGYTVLPRLGAAGGLGTPHAIASAFALGAAYVLLGSVHQACVESGTAPLVKEMLAQAGIADVAMTSSADMFEMGGRVQVLQRGTMMPQRGNHLYSLYHKYRSIEDIPESELAALEKDIFRKPVPEIWKETEEFFRDADPSVLERAKKDTRHRMGLIFRWYLGRSSQWAVKGVEDRRLDYQIWCGPSIGAFNAWTKRTFLEKAENRSIQAVSRNLMKGAAIITRAHQLRTYGVPVSEKDMGYRPEPLV